MGLRSLVTSVIRVSSLVAFAAALSSCKSNSSSTDGNSYRSQTPEADYAGTPTTFSGATTLITATARFNRYSDTGVTGLNSIESNLPIRYAEVHILDSGGNRIQQGETDASGAISLAIPRTAGTYTLRVNSRSNNSHLKASVLKDPFDTQYYSLDTSFTLSGSETTAAVTIQNAQATNSSDLLGGAFNILDQILVANDFLRSQAYLASCTFCVNNFTVAPKIQIYWQKGLTPGTYFGSSSYAISFFLAESGSGLYRGLYILGGLEGDVCSDTDHFDRSVLLHEYGHFLEDIYGKSASPGGSHDGNSLIDPRLAWSEGWADYFQAAALGRSYYRDTSKNAGCSGGARLSFSDFDLETKANTDVPVADEGIFREISIARTLYDVMTGASQSSTYNMTSNTDSHSADMGFAPIWNSFQSMNSASYHFQNMGMLNEILAAATNASYSSTIKTNYLAVLANEEQVTDRSLYAQPISAQGTCSWSIAQTEPVADNVDSSGYITFSDPLRSNDYFSYEYDGSSAKAVIYLRYKKSGGTISTPYDLDLYVYKEDHTLLDSTSIVASSTVAYPESGGTTSYPGYERIDLTGQAAGTYLINVKVYYSARRATTSYILQNSSGASLCP